LRPTTFAAVMVSILAATSEARAAFITTITQSGPDVVATGTGSLNINALTVLGPVGGVSNNMNPSVAYLAIGVDGAQNTFYFGMTVRPSNFGTGAGSTPSTVRSGPIVTIQGNDALVLPQSYVSGSTFSSSATWSGSTYASLGLTPGTYVFSWGSGADADSYTIQVVSPVPETSHTLLAGLAGAAAFGLARRRSRRSA
jgi:hypothetical protein